MRNERGVALVLALFLVTAMSILAGSLMFLSQTETYASMNYRMMSQARYGAEAGVQKAANFLLDQGQYLSPTTPPNAQGDSLASYEINVSPVTCTTGCASNGAVVLSAQSGVSSNYPVGAVATAFNSAAHGWLTAGSTTVEYSATATLISMHWFESYGGGPVTIQTWQITGTGTLTGSRKASVEVVALIETPKIPASTYGAFATDNTCGALNFGGNIVINSYDSGQTGLSGSTAPTMASSGGNVGTNGNLSISGSVDVQGNLYTPRSGVGNCADGAVNALTETGHADVSGSVVQLPTTVVYPTPPIPTQSLLPAVNISSLATPLAVCTSLGLTYGTPTSLPAGNCKESGSTLIIDASGSVPVPTLPSINMSSHTNIRFVAGSPPAQYSVNSITLAGGSEINVQTSSATQSALLNVVGLNPDGSAIATPIDLTGGTYSGPTGCTACSNYDASLLQILYGGTGNVNFTGNSNAAITIYAPNATATLSGTADVYGSILAKRLTNTGNASIHYDRRLGRDFYVKGNPLASTFTWKRY